MADDIAAAEDLYRLDPGEFVAARDALARRLRADGDRDEAGRVAKLRRPPATAWALNRAAREHPELLDEALRAGQALREATEAALGGDARGLRAASATERAASDRFVGAAGRYLGDGAGAAQPRLAGTLRAAVTDDLVADALRRGVLSADHESPAFGFATGVDLGPAPSSPPRQKSERAKAPTDAKPDAAARKAAEREAVDARRRLAEDRKELARLERSAERLAHLADEADAAAIQAHANADAAREALEEARTRLTPP